ncbi:MULTISPECIES: TetR/AcrR family transcriptional regulator [Streptomyces]|uniref:TetR/AcrR family transcriptional regulator n=2 Tax=Streptomyces TaxID=1883 RepID=UPI00081BBB4A|nr:MULTISPECIES: TetR/AcrR family transcriptional regulator [unclassified Streptomyces]MYQ52183.1 TetR family transcriptional regulator [Streptomyces sp. SID4941]SCD77114.1 transcriptional regulator, TetR family [Streptomyces sp. PalvLS-984]SDB89421.1 transcriptional regulator, TetR family [Streptomyces sp. AmelKG-A3]
MANLREQQKQMTRRLLLESGLDLFTTKGYAATTVDDIATTAGTTRVTFYAYFSSRSELMKALMDERLNEALERVGSSGHGSTARDLVATVADGTPDAVMAWLRRTADSWPAIRPIIRAGRDAAVVDPELTDLVERWMGEAISDIEDGLTAAGRFEPHQRRFRGVLAMAQLDFVAQNWDRSDWKLTRDQMLDELGASWVGLLT